MSLSYLINAKLIAKQEDACSLYPLSAVIPACYPALKQGRFLLTEVAPLLLALPDEELSALATPHRQLIGSIISEFPSEHLPSDLCKKLRRNGLLPPS